MSWWSSLMAHFGHRSVANTSVTVNASSAEREQHSEELRRRADRIYNDLKSVRRIEIVVRRK